MAKKKSAAPMVAAADDGRQEYVLAAGVTVVNSRKVTGRTVRLTLAEALYDLSLGRIVLQREFGGSLSDLLDREERAVSKTVDD